MGRGLESPDTYRTLIFLAGRSISHICPTFTTDSPPDRGMGIIFHDDPMSLLEAAENPEDFDLPDYGHMVSENITNYTKIGDDRPKMEFLLDPNDSGPFARQKTEEFAPSPDMTRSDTFFWDLPAHLR